MSGLTLFLTTNFKIIVFATVFYIKKGKLLTILKIHFKLILGVILGCSDLLLIEYVWDNINGTEFTLATKNFGPIAIMCSTGTEAPVADEDHSISCLRHRTCHQLQMAKRPPGNFNKFIGC